MNNSNNNNLSRKISNNDHHQATRRRKKSIFHQNPHQNGGACASLKKRTTINDSNDSAEIKSRRRSTYFVSGSTAHNEHNICAVLNEGSYYDADGFDHTDYKEHYRRTLLQMYAEDELAKHDEPSQSLDSTNHNYSTSLNNIANNNNNQSCVEANRMYMFIKYMATEHESLLQLLIFLPLILTSFYIAFVEKKPLIT